MWKAKELAESGKYADAWRILSPHLMDEPNDPRGLVLASYLLEKQGQAPIAYHLCRSLTQLYPGSAVAWTNLGKTCDTLWRMDEAEAAYKRALSQSKTDDIEGRVTIFTNLSAMYLQIGQFEKAHDYAQRALKLDPEHLKSRHNAGISLLAAGRWGEGWKQYEASVGSPQRPLFKYGDEPTWAGEPGKTVVIYGEQGIGDEICAASMVPDAMKVASKVILDCDKRLERLFKRSFPAAKVYGTRNQMTLNWDDQDQQIDYSIASMQAGAIFRPNHQSFPGTPYLVADPDRVLMWKALWQSKGKRCIGIAWSGGLRETASKFRRWDHDQLYEIMRGIDAHWVCLQYKDAAEEVRAFKAKYPDIDIGLYQHATLSSDYDDMAALVGSLDAVVAMQSTAVHTAGALGVPCAAGVPTTSQWRYGSEGDRMPWYNSVRLFRQRKEWDFEGIRKWLS